MEEFWPYVVPLPIKKGRQYEVLLSLFRSKASIDIMRHMLIEGVTYQRDIIAELPYSNKTIIERLGSLVSANVLSEGMEKSRERRAWVKRYELTSLGKWIKLLLVPPQSLSEDKIEELVRELLKIYVEGAVKMCLKHRINPEIVKAAFEEAYYKAKSENPAVL